MHVVRTGVFLLGGLLIAAPVPGMDRLEVPGGTDALRRVTKMPPHVTDDMLLVEAARAWYGVRDPFQHPSGAPQGLVQHLAASMELPAPGPAMPLPLALWSDLLNVNSDPRLALALASNRDAMLLYHGLMGMDDATLGWMATRRELLSDLLARGAAPFASVAPSVRIVDGSVAVPGAPAAARAWQEVVDAPPSRPEEFVRKLMQRHSGRLAWMFSVLSSLDDRRLRFAIGERGEHLQTLLRHFSGSAPEWSMYDRPFWRPSFDVSLPLLLMDLGPKRTPHGSEGFWREVFRTEDVEDWRESGTAPLTAPVLLDLIFGEQPHRGRERWAAFAYGQRLLAQVPPSRDAGIALRGALGFSALSVALERSGIHDPALQAAMFRTASRVTLRDPNGDRGDLAAWQGAVAIVESSSLRGGLDATETAAAYRALAALPASAPAREVTAWLLGDFVPKMLARRGAPASAERALLQTLAGALTAGGPRVPPAFPWEDLTYAFVPHAVAWHRMEAVRAAQDGPSLDEALAAWRAGTDQGRAKAESMIARMLPALVYAPHQAASDTPALGADVAFRHDLVPADDGPDARRRRPWLVARGDSDARTGWRLKGSLLALDLALFDWYLNRQGEMPSTAPSLDEPDIISLSQMAVLAASARPSELKLDEALAALDRGRAAAERLATARDLDAALARAGIDPWRRRALRLHRERSERLSGAGRGAASDGARQGARDPADSSQPALLLSELWRMGGAVGFVTPRWALDGCACFGPVPAAPALLEGRRSSGLVGATSPDPVLRVAEFLRAQQLPPALLGGVFASAVVDVIHGAQGVRPDDRHALAVAAASISDARLEEHLLALVASGALARP